MTDVQAVEILGKKSIFVGRDMDEFIASDLIGILGGPGAVGSASVVVVTDDNVSRVALEPRLRPLLLERVGVKKENLLVHVIKNGEHSKRRETKENIEDAMLAARCSRQTLVIALGGGVVGDMTGFVAATFMRGVRFVQIPTTLLGMVDSSIGGKTGLNTPSGKNLVGAFHQPLRVYVDTLFLATLPERQLNNGMAEVIKSFAIRNAEWFAKVEEPWNLNKQEDLDRLDAAVLECCRIKADVVTQDEKEGGLRALLNFGHTVGHAIEKYLYDTMLHGECVAIGMVKEAQIARALGHLSSADVTRLSTCLKSHGLPTILTGKHQELTVKQLMDAMAGDKKTVGSTKKVVLLKSLGATVENTASAVDDELLRVAIARNIEIKPSATPLAGQIRVPGSKSISNRVLLLAALGVGSCRITGLLHSDDTRVMMGAITTLGLASFDWEDNGATIVVHGGGGKGLAMPSAPATCDDTLTPKEVYLQNAGTASRFLTTLCCMVSGPAPVRVCGNERMHIRPIRDLANALKSNGCDIAYKGVDGCLPLLVKPTGLKGGEIKLAATVSSQYVSSVLMSSPYALSSVILKIDEGKTVSQTYIDMTVSLMRQFGIVVEKVMSDDNLCYHIPQGVYQNPTHVAVEADASSSTYPLAFAAITGGDVTVNGVGKVSLQGDAGFCRVLAGMGCTVLQTDDSTRILGIDTAKKLPEGRKDTPDQLQGIDIDMEDLTDAFMTAAAVAAVCPGTITRITGIANQRVKECNRIAAMVEELGKCGVSCSELPDGIQIHGRPVSELHGAVIDCRDDHRIAMSFAVLGSVVSGIIIDDKECVGKTYTEFWEHMSRELGLSYSFSSSTTAIAKVPSPIRAPVAVIVGMRGVGKTTMGRAAATAIGWDFIDADTALEAEVGITIKELIARDGWVAFRDQEHKTLKRLMARKSSSGKGTVLSCGGGVVEREENRKMLASHWPVIHLTRDINDIISDLETVEKAAAAATGSSERPKYAGGATMIETWEKRQPWFVSVSDYEFHCCAESGHKSADGSHYLWSHVTGDFIRFLTARVLGISRCADLSTPLPPLVKGAADIYSSCTKGSFFVCLTYPRIEDAIVNLPEIIVGANVIELRVDLLADHSPASVTKQVLLLRQHTDLPVIFTVRTVAQGGGFGGSADALAELMLLAVRLGLEYVDIEQRWCSKVKDPIFAALDRPAHRSTGADAKRERRTKAIVSEHCYDDNLSRSDLLHLFNLCEELGKADVIKVVTRAFSIDDVYCLRQVASNDFHTEKPVIALATTAKGQLSRVLNAFLCPVTHPLLPAAAAPGQMSVAEIHRARSLLGAVGGDGGELFLIGTGISRSPSPAMHNALFASLGLPLTYGLFDTTEVSDIEKLFKSNSFYGANVTIPFKQAVIPFMSTLSPAAKAIGAVNTVVKDPVTGLCSGHNTDWLGILIPLRRALLASLPRVISGRRAGLVIGAGGTSRAAVFALKQMHSLDIVIIWNPRTTAKASALAEAFGNGVSFVATLDELPAVLGPSDTIVAVVGTIPPTAQSEAVIAAVKDHVLVSKPAVLDAVYLPRRTNLLKAAAAAGCITIEGKEMLLEQGVFGSELWINARTCPATLRKGLEGHMKLMEK